MMKWTSSVFKEVEVCHFFFFFFKLSFNYLFLSHLIAVINFFVYSVKCKRVFEFQILFSSSLSFTISGLPGMFELDMLGFLLQKKVLKISLIQQFSLNELKSIKGKKIILFVCSPSVRWCWGVYFIDFWSALNAFLVTINTKLLVQRFCNYTIFTSRCGYVHIILQNYFYWQNVWMTSTGHLTTDQKVDSFFFWKQTLLPFSIVFYSLWSNHMRIVFWMVCIVYVVYNVYDLRLFRCKTYWLVVFCLQWN